MNLHDAREAFGHWAHPMAAPLAAIGAGAAAADSTGLLLPVNVWVEVLQVLVLVVVFRTVLFFEFRVHERKERMLYEGIVKSGESFDEVWRQVKARTTALEQWKAEAHDTLTEHTAKLSELQSRTKRLEDHPILRRVGV